MDISARFLRRNYSTPENAHLFYDVLNKKLRFYDATSMLLSFVNPIPTDPIFFYSDLTPDALTTLASLNPNLTHLHLDYCGRLTSPVLLAFATSMPQLTSLTLLGPFLVRAEAWIEFFKATPNLRAFRITQSPRLNSKCVRTLAESCTKLEELSLREIGLMDNSFADPLCCLPPLRMLDLASPGIGIDEDGWLMLMERHGSTLETLDASKHEFTDRVLQEGVRKYARVLTELKLEQCFELTDEGVAAFFNNWTSPISNYEDDDDDDMDVDPVPVEISPASLEGFTPNPPLHVLSLARNQELSSAALTAAIKHSAQSLTWLNVNGLRSASSEALAELKRATELRYLDAGWCRELDDFVMKDVAIACTKLSEIKVWGCSRVRGIGWGVKVSQAAWFTFRKLSWVYRGPSEYMGSNPTEAYEILYIASRAQVLYEGTTYKLNTATQSFLVRKCVVGSTSPSRSHTHSTRGTVCAQQMVWAKLSCLHCALLLTVFIYDLLTRD
jgi:DNA repair protein RAD7